MVGRNLGSLFLFAQPLSPSVDMNYEGGTRNMGGGGGERGIRNFLKVTG